jgi:hypothetical protein
MDLEEDIERDPPREELWPMRCANNSDGKTNATKTKRIPNLCFMFNEIVVMII